MAKETSSLPPRVFVASSSASLPLANRLRDLLKPQIEAVVWDTLFQPGDNTLQNLILFSSLYEFGVFVLSADDLTVTRDGDRWEPRDNVIFELGLFMGALGQRRALAVVVRGDKGKTKLPTDLAGNTYAEVDAAKLLSGRLARKEVDAIRRAIIERSTNAPLSLLPGTSLAMGYFQNYLIPLGRLLQEAGELPTSGGTVDLAAQGYEMTLLIPTSLADAGIPHRDQYIRKNAFSSAVLPPPAPGPARRGYDFFVDGAAGDGPVQVYDYPTTLRAAHEAIRLVLREGAFGERDREYEILADREVRNFTRALSHLLAQPDGRVFPNPVRFRYI